MTMEAADRIRQYRKQAGLSKAELAEKLGVLKDDVDMWEEDDKAPTTAQWAALAAAFNVDEETLRGEERSYFRDKERLKADVQAGKRFLNKANYPLFITFLYLCLGFIWDMWHPGWLIFFTIPLFYLPEKYRTPRKLLTSPVAITLIYLILGIYCNLWHPGWLIFFAIPLLNTFFD